MQSDAPRRIQRKCTKGWKAPEGAVYVGRGSIWGNPFRTAEDCAPARAVALYEQLLTGKPSLLRHGILRVQKGNDGKGEGAVLKMLDRLPELRGKTLMCWCKEGSPCHGDALLRLANAPAAQEGEKANG